MQHAAANFGSSKEKKCRCIERCCLDVCAHVALTNVLFWYLLVAWEDSALLQLAQASAKTFEHFFQIVVVNLESW